MTLRNVFLIARRDYVAYVGRRRFWISLLFSPTILLGFMGYLQNMVGYQRP